MAVPLSAAAVLAALRAEGVRVVEVGDWRNHNRNHKGAWGPVNGVMIHHTVTQGTDHTVALCRDGHSALPGPLCHGVIAKDGRVHMVGWGRANHAGLGDDDVLQAVIDERALPADNEANTDGNRHFYGFECENLGDGEDPWPAAQLEAIERVSAAICRHHGWGDSSVIGHLEWQPGKVDPRGFTMSSMRARIHDRLARPADSSPGPTTPPHTPIEEDPMAGYSEEQIGDAVLYRDNIKAPADDPNVKKNGLWSLASYVRSIYNAANTVRAEQRETAAKVDQLAQAVDTLTNLVKKG